MKLAEETETGGEDALREHIDHLVQGATALNQAVHGTTDIIVFSSDVIESGVYDYAQPSTYLSCDAVRPYVGIGIVCENKRCTRYRMCEPCSNVLGIVCVNHAAMCLVSYA